MPTVRADIKPRVVFLAPEGISGAKPLRVFPAEQWEKWGGEPGMWRVQIGTAWVARKGEGKVSFFTEDGVAAIIDRWARGALGFAVVDKPLTPTLAKGTRVWVRTEFPVNDKDSKVEVGWGPSFTRTPPFQDEHGEWRVWVGLVPAPVLLADLRPREGAEGLYLKPQGKARR